MTVFVRWYGNILEGELLEGEYLGMKQVRIPLDGHKPIALYTPEHVYQFMAEALAGHEEFTPAEVKNKKFEVTIDPQPDVLPADDRQSIEAFKQANWDHKRNHIQIDKLEEFYQLWRMYMVPFGYTDDTKRQETKTVTLTEVAVWPAEKPVSKRDTPTRPKLTKKQKNSTGVIEYADSTLLSIF